MVLKLQLFVGCRTETNLYYTFNHFYSSVWKSFWKLVSFTSIICFYSNIIKVKAQHFQTFSKSHSLICFVIGQTKQTFCILHTCKRMHAVYFGIRKNYTHANIKQPTKLANIAVTEKRSWGRLGMSERSLWPRVKNVSGMSHWFIFSWTNSIALKN